ncbi:MAG: hypothetical protein RJB66_1580 [Pseudomonadota bacterium]|jgi:hypothetical protein
MRNQLREGKRHYWRRVAVFLVVFGTTGLLLFSFQNFTKNSTQEGKIDSLSSAPTQDIQSWSRGLDPLLNNALSAIDVKYSPLLSSLAKCPGRSRELKIESLRTKMDLLRSSFYTNLPLAGINASHAFLSESAKTLTLLSNELSAIPRPEVHVIAMHEPREKGAHPVRILVTGHGTGVLLLSSYESAHFEVEVNPGATLKRVIVHGYKNHKISGVDISIIERRDNPNAFKISAYNTDYAKALLDFFMSEETRQTGTCLDFTMASHQGAYSGTTAPNGIYTVNLAHSPSTNEIPMMISLTINGECLTQDSIRGGGQYPDQSRESCISKCKDFFNSASALAKVYDCRFLASNKDEVVLSGRAPLAQSSTNGQCVTQDSIRGGKRFSIKNRKACISECKEFLSEASPIARVYDCRMVSAGKEEIVLPGRTAL